MSKKPVFIKNLSRRTVLQGSAATGVFVLGATLIGCGRNSAEQADSQKNETPQNETLNPINIFVSLSSNGAVEVRCHQAEMGQHIRTGIARIIADEMDASWDRVTVIQAEGDRKYGDQSTGGSKSIRRDFVRLRRIGASARSMLVRAAAETWEVPLDECKADLHQVVHQATGRKLGYGDLAALAATYEPPAFEADEIEAAAPHAYRLKSREEWRYIGKAEPSVDLQAILSGEAIYGQDVRLPNMKFAVIARSPVNKGKLVSFDAEAALTVPGVINVIEVPAPVGVSYFKHIPGVAVIAENTWAAIQGRNALKIKWDDGEFGDYDSSEYRKEIEATVRSPQRVVRDKGDVDSALKQASITHSAEYYVPHYAHTPMEPPAALAEWQDGKMEVWTSTQAPENTRKDVSHVTGLSYDDVHVNNMLLGGSFGRKSMADFAMEAALLSKELKTPIKVVWTREDDIQHDYYHGVSAQRIDAGLDENGGLLAWQHRVTFPPIRSIRDASAVSGSDGELGNGFADNPFVTPNMRLENGEAKGKTRIGWYRSVHNLQHAFAVQSFAAELADAAGRDQKDYLLELIGPDRIINLEDDGLKIEYNNHRQSLDEFPIDTARLKNVLNIAADKIGWRSDLPSGRGMGVAAHRNFLSYVAMAVEVEIVDGELTIPQVQIACDCGLAVNPESVKAQLEGGCLFGLSTALDSEITMSNGKVNQSNFHDYKVLRIDRSPRNISVTLVEHDDQPPGGIGEASTPCFIPAFTNAIFAATGKRIRSLPIGDQLRA